MDVEATVLFSRKSRTCVGIVTATVQLSESLWTGATADEVGKGMKRYSNLPRSSHSYDVFK